MSFIIRIRRAAERDIAKAQSWYELQRPGLGADFHSEFTQVITPLAETPFIYTCVHRDIRRGVFHRYPYLVWYRVVRNIVKVLAVTDGRQDPSKALSRFQ